MTKIITKEIEYAYVRDMVLLPNIQMDDGYKTRLSISYDLKDTNGVFIEVAHKEHYSTATEAMLTYAEYTAWREDNEADFIAADKLDLAGYEP